MLVSVVLEEAPKRSFASALDWPGWSRSGKTPEAALEALVASGPRYARVARRAGIDFSPPTSTADLRVVERLRGDASTEFGVPAASAAAEEASIPADEYARLVRLLRAAWDELDDMAWRHAGAELRKGPRGGGRELPKIVQHVLDAEAAYVGQLGAKPPKDADLAAMHQAFLATLEARVTDRPIEHPRRTKRPWSPRYAVRRTAWHALDHAWEIEDRATG